MDAPFRSAPAPGVDVMFESGHFTWWPKATVQAIRAAHLWLDDYTAEHGPFDAVCGFSQGCSLIISYLLYHGRETPAAPLPFKAAIFVCGGVPYAVLEDLGLDVSQRAKDINDSTGRALKRKAGALKEMAARPDTIQHGVGLWDNTVDLEHDPGAMPPPDDVFVNIPTVHVYGSKDPRWPSSMQLAYFCKDKVMYDHGGATTSPVEQCVRQAGRHGQEGHRQGIALPSEPG